MKLYVSVDREARMSLMVLEEEKPDCCHSDDDYELELIGSLVCGEDSGSMSACREIEGVATDQSLRP